MLIFSLKTALAESHKLSHDLFYFHLIQNVSNSFCDVFYDSGYTEVY